MYCFAHVAGAIAVQSLAVNELRSARACHSTDATIRRIGRTLDTADSIEPNPLMLSLSKHGPVTLTQRADDGPSTGSG